MAMCRKANPFLHVCLVRSLRPPLEKPESGCGITVNLSYFVCTYVNLKFQEEKELKSFLKSSQMCKRMERKSLISA